MIVADDWCCIACMRLRKLGKGQSVVFYVTEEIQSKIRAIMPMNTTSSINVADVLDWSIHETSRDLRASIPLWATQGIRYERQACVWQQAGHEGTYELSVNQATRFLEDEAASLHKRYHPRHLDANDLSGSLSSMKLEETDSPGQSEILARCARFGCFDIGLVPSLREEQERELSPEIEQERQVERPPPATPLKHEIHPDVRAFIHSGVVSKSSTGFIPAFQILRDTTLSTLFDMDKFPVALLVTRDFSRTVRLPQQSGQKPTLDAFQRPVQWVLTSTNDEGIIKNLVIISPFEAQAFMPILRTNTSSSKTSLRLYAPRSNLAFWPLDHLGLYSIPTVLHQRPRYNLPNSFKVQLNLFAGQLYINCFRDYTMVCDYLCLAWRSIHTSSSVNTSSLEIQADGFIVPASEEARIGEGDGGDQGSGNRLSPRRLFLRSPTQVLRLLLIRIRHDCESIDTTHLGRLLKGEQLCESDFEACINKQ